MAEHSAKWMILVASTWIQASTGTNFDFSSYSSELKSNLGISQMQLTFLSMASDMGKAFGWCSGISLLYFPIWVVLISSALMGFLGYGLQWLVIQRVISLPYSVVFLLCLLAGCSICWFNTVCFVLCIRHFTSNRPTALSLSISYNSVSAALYNLMANSITSRKSTVYLLLNAVVPLMTSLVAAVPITWLPPGEDSPTETENHDFRIFLCLFIQATFTGLYLLTVNLLSYNSSVACMLVAGAVTLLLLPLFTLPILWYRNRTNNPSLSYEMPKYSLISTNEPGGSKQLMVAESLSIPNTSNGNSYQGKEKNGRYNSTSLMNRLIVLGEEHSSKALMQRLDFWLYYIAYFCGGTIGLIFSNNLGQITQSHGFNSDVTSLVSLYSACSFMGRLLAAAPDFLNDKMYYPRSGWFAFSMIPIPFSFLLLVLSGRKAALIVSTAFIGVSSGFIFSAAVSITAELFGPNSAGINHNILITNIPLGSLVHGGIAALVYQANIGNSDQEGLAEGLKVCIGRECYTRTFALWGCASLLGLASSLLLFLRTKSAYDRLQKKQCWR